MVKGSVPGSCVTCVTWFLFPSVSFYCCKKISTRKECAFNMFNHLACPLWEKTEKKPLYTRSCRSEFNLWIPFSVEILAFMSHQTQVYIDSVMSSSMLLCNLSYVAYFQSLSCLCFLWAWQWHCPVCWTGIIWFPFYRWKDWSLRKIGDLSGVPCLLPMKFRTRSQVQCAFNPCRKNLAIYFGH